MIKKVSIQLNQSLICGGMAVVEREGKEVIIDFDVVKSPIPEVIVGGRGKRVRGLKLSDEEVDMYEEMLMDLFIHHNVPFQIGTYAVSA